MCIGWKLNAAEECGILKIICICEDEKSILIFQMFHEDASDLFDIDIWEHVYTMINCNIFCKIIS